jgi:hypothetical protein
VSGCARRRGGWEGRQRQATAGDDTKADEVSRTSSCSWATGLRWATFVGMMAPNVPVGASMMSSVPQRLHGRLMISRSDRDDRPIDRDLPLDSDFGRALTR